ncbi:MAG: hypothetical protein K2X48_01345 [Chitinophagaceae bacterium]|nr:hypothetical protein [Chitinophagaceae bacterium]
MLHQLFYLSAMKKWIFMSIVLLFCSCKTLYHLTSKNRNPVALTGSAFYREAVSMDWRQRDSFALREILNGNLPEFLNLFTPVPLSVTDSSSGKTISATLFVTADYLSIGSNNDWARIPLTPMAAQIIADSFHCFLPTQKLVDDIYKHAVVKLSPVWMFAYRDSTPTMYHHHLMVEGLRQQRTGLIAGIKKDVILTNQLINTSKPNRVAIYGWHQPDGKPIQPVYTGHVNRYVDYSHGIRLIYRRMKVNHKWMDVAEVMNNQLLRKLITYEAEGAILRYTF